MPGNEGLTARFRRDFLIIPLGNAAKNAPKLSRDGGRS
jgi:hypothetical protein